MSKRVMPPQRRGESKQNFATPRDFLSAVETRFGRISFDLAATKRNARHPRFFSPKDDALVQDWTRCPGKHLWLNPEFAHIDPWAAKCAATALEQSGKILSFLTPASVGADWFRDYVHQKAFVLPLNGRLTFDGLDLYPKDCMLSIFGLGVVGFEPWDWRADMSDDGRKFHERLKGRMQRRRAARRAEAA